VSADGSRSVIVEADGGSRGNPGPAGCGAVVRDAATGEVLLERSGGLGRTTNNVAEYEGLLAGLRAAAELGASAVDVRMDSKLVVEQMSGRWKIKHPQLQQLALAASKLAQAFDRVRFEWIPRERNSYADRLANQAMDAQAADNARGGGKGGSTQGLARARTTTATATATTAAATRTAATRTGFAAEAAAAAQTAPPHVWTGAIGVPTRLLLLRHGQTERSAQRRYSGRADVPLTAIGEQQAAAAARRLSTADGVAAVVTSPLSRAGRTGRAVADALGLDLVRHEGLLEIDFGAWEGLTFAEAAERDPELHARWLRDPTVAPPGGESFEDAYHRIDRARRELIATYGGASVVVVSHVTPIKVLLRMALDVGPSLLYRLHLDLTSLSVAEFYPDGNASVSLVNDTTHL
jgi:probable phosphoglycerate mutase